MRLLYTIDSLTPHGGGKQLLLLVEALAQRGFEQRVVAFGAGPLQSSLARAGADVRVAPRRFALDPWAIGQLARESRHFAPDVVHAFGPLEETYCRVAVHHRVPLVAQTAPGRPSPAWRRWSNRLRGKRVVRYVYRSSLDQQFEAAQGRRRAAVVIAKGVAPAAASSVDRATLLAELHLPPESRLVLSLAKLRPETRIKDLIWATDQVHCVRDDIHLLVAGEGPQLAALRRYAHLNHIADHVHFLGPRSDVADLLPHCDCLGDAHRGLGQSSAMLEAMSAGVPVVAVDSPAHRQIVAPELTARLTPQEVRSGFAREILRSVEDAQLATHVSATARRHVERSFPAVTMVDRFASLYRSLD